MKTIRNAIMLMALIAPLASLAGAPSNPVSAFRQKVNGDAMLMEVYASDGMKELDAAKRGLADSDALVAGAVEAAKGHDDLRSATKAYYVAAKTYFESAFTPVPLPGLDGPSAEAIQLKATKTRLKSELDAKGNALDLELKLAGFPNE